ncbi:hypothetical protein [Streptomyces sp. NPDC087294]|uniref:hypothetical protein n=1 Tax=Streptomyces sp. NPDC087294 TaxID=3365777 RepID=UPI0038209B26
MHVSENLRRLRHLRALRTPRKDHEPLGLMDMLLEPDADSDHPAQWSQWSSLEISFFGFRARSHGRTAFAALRAMRHEHPVLVHALCTYLSVSSFLVVAIVAFVLRGR